MAVTGGSDTNAGTVSSPLKTLVKAVAKAVNGQQIVLRSGTYHEAVVVPTNKQLVIQSYPKETVWLDGSSKISTFSQSGSTWKASNWSFAPSSVMDGKADNPGFVDPAHPMAARPDQVFYDGVALVQVGSAAQVKAGTFYADHTNKTLTIGNNPSGHKVSASDLAQAVYVMSSGTVLQGFGVRRYATSYGDRAALRLANTNITARDIVVEDSAMIGVNVENNGVTLDHLTVVRSGLMGIGANASYGLVIKNSQVTNNNSEQFKPAPVSGGIKVTRSRGVTIANNNTSNNYGSGIWLDESCYDVKVTGNVSSGNQYTGIQLEISSNAIIANNDVSNQQFGVQLFDASNVKIFNNTIGNNAKFGVRIYQDQRRQATASFAGHDPRQPIPDSTVTWITKNITVADNAFGSGGFFQVWALDGVTHIPADQMAITVAGNLFNPRTTTAQATMLAWGGSDNTSITRYDTAASMLKKSSAFVNRETTASEPLSSMATEISAAASGAVGLPSDVAAAVGQPTGTKRVGRF
ncbi:right-handed parallel beta-helix repeat-containing protein [Subtercola boreus]|uniref:Carbohydrate-binding/sugar hydrolysis domain-containing protein n=1 Tax=Subtercola boreus TaxID=120213 RepID=A0A3E0WAT0_9MICO|nr:right-handed parallel beta-helix repeat-containing protein [Subtercola boreus]RFA21186.1 hypothetical protein B7R24_07290 [Subtercola boreus]RFA21569.1 hypothetical protein B7R23_07235 [Subtercola boreus]RFA27539.1 hypothetical protein B7R25_07360 [Subtercola boreus]